MQHINDIDRPDVNGVKPKMSEIADLARQEFKNLIPFLKVKCDDNLMSNISIVGSFDNPETWQNGIFLNSRCFRFSITPKDKKQYYNQGETVIIELSVGSHKLINKFRKSTATPEKAVARLKAWILDSKKDLENTEK